MARVTIEDCLDYVDNKYKLVLLAAKRARQIEGGADLFVPREDDKPAVIALREIAAGFILSKKEEQNSKDDGDHHGEEGTE